MNVRATWAAAVCTALVWAPGAAASPEPGSAAGARAGAQADPALTIVEPDDQSQLAGVVRLRADVAPADDGRGGRVLRRRLTGLRGPRPAVRVRLGTRGRRAEAHVVRVAARLGGGRRVVRSVLTRAGPVAFFSTETSAVLVPVAVRDRRGRFVDGLTRDDFALYEDGVRQELSFFESADMDLVLAVDFSASMGSSMQLLRSAVRRFLGELPGTARLSLLAFNDRVFVVAQHEQDRDRLLAAVDDLPRPYGGTSLLDAVVHALEIQEGDVAHRAVVLFSDGDERDSFTNFATAEQRIRAGRATLYAITMGRNRAIERVRAQLGSLARISGGQSFSIARIDDLDEALTYVREDLENRYVLGYAPSNRRVDGAWRSIEVRTANRRHAVQAREGYLAVPSY